MGLVQTLQALNIRDILGPIRPQAPNNARPKPHPVVGPRRKPELPDFEFGPWNMPIDCNRNMKWFVDRDAGIFHESVHDKKESLTPRDHDMAIVVDTQIQSRLQVHQEKGKGAEKRQLTANDGVTHKKTRVERRIRPRKRRVGPLREPEKQVPLQYRRVGRNPRPGPGEPPIAVPPVAQMNPGSLNPDHLEPGSSQHTVVPLLPQRSIVPPPSGGQNAEGKGKAKTYQTNGNNDKGTGRPLQTEAEVVVDNRRLKSLVVTPKKSPKVVKFAMQAHDTSADMDEDSPPTSRLMNAARGPGVGPKPGPSTQLPGRAQPISGAAGVQVRTVNDVLHTWTARPDDPAHGGDLAIVFTALFRKMENMDRATGPASNMPHRRNRKARQDLQDDTDNDSESDFRGAPLPNRSKVKHRKSGYLELQEHIRTTCAKWMGRADNKSPFMLPGDRTLELYEALGENSRGPCIDREHPKEHPWKFDVAHTATSQWNQGCIALFVDEYLKLSDAKSTKRKLVKQVVTVHWKALNAQWKCLNRNNLEDHDREKLATQTLRSNKYSRRAQLLRRRIQGLQQHRLSRKFLHVVQASGIAAQSDDELVVIGGTQYARTEKLEWRSPDLIKLFQLADNLHLSTKFNPAGQPNTHIFPRARVIGSFQSQRKPVPDLPANCYADAWKKKQSAAYLEGLRMRDPEDLKIPSEVRRFAANFKTKSIGKQLQQARVESEQSMEED